MFAYLKGTIARIYAQQNRFYLDFEVGGVGYEVQVLSRWAQALERQLLDNADRVYQIMTHLQVREDQWLLFGFATIPERDLFRSLMGVSGIGSQSALALLDALEVPLLVEAIVTENIRALSQAPGIGKKTAERLILELKTKLKGWETIAGAQSQSLPSPAIQEEVELALLGLGYTEAEIFQALLAVGETLGKTSDPDGWLRETLVWLSEQGTHG
jgi:holliday junction DNA helicase RuvA